MIRIPIGAWFEGLINWIKDTFEGFFDACGNVIDACISVCETMLEWPHPVLLIALLAGLAWWAGGRKRFGLPIFALVGFFLILSMNLWDPTIETLALVLVSTCMALLVGVPVGIYAGRSETGERIVRPVLDFMQTMPAFVYLIPAVLLFSLGKVPGAIATVIFAMPPCVRLTTLGLRQVPEDVLEASDAFGATPMQQLLKVQLPMALPSILAGVNQTIMLALSMVVISAMIGAGGLGGVVWRGITQLQIGRGFEGGIAIVILAMYLDRVTNAMGSRSSRRQQAGSES